MLLRSQLGNLIQEWMHMALTHKDFMLTDDQLNAINLYFKGRATEYAVAGEDVASGGVKVEFEWASPWGRFVTAKFDGEVCGMEVEIT